MKKIKDLIKKYPNNYELGSNIRRISNILDVYIKKIIKQYPNDFDLGEYFRNLFK